MNAPAEIKSTDAREGHGGTKTPASDQTATGELETGSNEISGAHPPVPDQVEGSIDASGTSTDSEGDAPHSFPSPQIDERLEEAVRQIFEIPTLDISEADKRTRLKETSDWWKGNCRADNHPRLRQIYETAQAVMRGDLERRKALGIFGEMLGCTADDLDCLTQGRSS